MLQFEGFASQAEAAAEVYRYIPFEVPLRCMRVDISYHFGASDGSDGCAVDIGIFDIRGTEPFTGGFRGWSGADRRTFFIERERATPGYLPGALPSGTWSIILGLYEVPRAGVRYWVTVEIESSVAELRLVKPAAPGAEVLAAGGAAARRWFRGDLHSHSVHSDGANTIPEIARFAKLRKLDFLAITDHNTTSHHAEIDAMRRSPVLLVPGEEVTTYRGHANVWGLREWADFRVTSDAEMHRVWQWVAGRKRPFSINHPKEHGPAWEMADPGFAIREVWQAPWRWYNWQSVGAWDELLSEGRRIIPVGGSDAHSVPPAEPKHPHHIGDPTTWLLCEGGLTEQSVLDAITAGRTVISESPTGPFVTLEGPDAEGRVVSHYRRAAGCDLVFIADGEARYRVALSRASGVVEVPGGIRYNRYLRAELRVEAPKSREDVRALSSPVYASSR